MKRRTLMKAVGLATAGAIFAGSALAQEVTLRFGHYGKPGDTAYMAAEHFKFTVENMTDGEVEISLHPASELGNSPTMLEGARLGSIDLVLVGNPYFTAFAPQVNLLDLPFLFQSADHAYAVMDGEVGDALMDSINQSNLQGLAFWEIGFRNLTNNTRAISTPEDLDGLKLRTTPNPAHIEAFQILGANPAPMPFAEVYSALQTGTIDGQENPVNHIYASKLHEVQKHLSLTAHAYTAAPLVINYGRFSRLDPEHQQALQVAAKLSASYGRALNAAKEAGSLQAMIDAGVEVVIEPDVAAFRDAVAEQTRVAYKEEFGDELLNKVNALAN
ncbi:MAG: DctP family TRAP transporter solute-binding subunit [Pseudomonadota bacterium]